MENLIGKVLDKFLKKFTTKTGISNILMVDSGKNVIIDTLTDYPNSNFELPKYIDKIFKIDEKYQKSEKSNRLLENVTLKFKNEQIGIHLSDNKTYIILYSNNENVDINNFPKEIKELADNVDSIILSHEVFLGKEVVDLDADIEKLEDYEKYFDVPKLDIKKLFKYTR